METFAQCIKTERLKKQMRLQDVSDRGGITIGTISQAERGADVKLATAHQIAQGLGVKLSTLLKRIGY